LKVEGV